MKRPFKPDYQNEQQIDLGWHDKLSS